MEPSWEAERFPPGKTCAEGKEDEVRTRWRRRIWLEGEMRRMLGNMSVDVDEGRGRVLPGAGSRLCDDLLGLASRGHVLLL